MVAVETGEGAVMGADWGVDFRADLGAGLRGAEASTGRLGSRGGASGAVVVGGVVVVEVWGTAGQPFFS
jgi:hypothetical protein